ncbi:MAG: PhnD/SsuA/transferrin family substrate-binding protein [Dissulfurimicrobium sp.]|uniref:PhnD/SsuA/transferrin family substrate-binding protein n=1 Tax=Dissulfurimicrobium sp. TaxID=2022436 RepID=UPI004049DC7C
MSLVKAKCLQLQDFFKRTFFTYSHDRSIQAVVQGIADGASVDSIIYENAIRKDKGIAQKTRVILTSQAFGMPPVVVPSQLAQSEKKRLKDIFLHMHENIEGERALAALGVERFVEPRPSMYKAVCLDYKEQSCNKK